MLSKNRGISGLRVMTKKLLRQKVQGQKISHVILKMTKKKAKGGT